VGGRFVTLTTAGESASSSTNAAFFNVTAGPAKLTQVSPNSGPLGQQNLSVTITGQATHFIQGFTSATFGAGISVSSLTVNSPTRATAVINIDPSASLGAHDVTLFTQGEVAKLAGGFTVIAGVPVITSVSPASGQQGQQNLSVKITGVFTHFAQGATVASFGAGVTVASLTVSSPTSATAVINIDPAAATGARDVTLTTGAEIATLSGGFTVTPGTPVITKVNPNTGAVGQQNLSVAITGMFTHFVQGSTVANFGGFISTVSLTVNSPTSATAVINISPSATAGPQTVTIFDPSEVVQLVNGFTITTSPVIAQINPNAAQQGTANLSVSVIGQNTHFVQGTTTASFGAGITVVSVTVNSATSATVVISIDPAATAGARDVTMTTGAEVVTRTGGFTVVPPPPSVSTNLPEGTTITSPTQITGSVNSGSWQLQYALASADGAVTNPVFITFSSGTSAVSGGVLGTLDPTVLLNGNYIIQLTSTDQFGQTSSVSSSVNVQGNAKVGNFTLSFRDLNVPAPGLPITVRRTYDSRDKGTHDFGIGWTLGLVNLRLQKNGVLGANWQMSSSGGLLPNFCLQESRPHIVTVTFPDNRVYKFEATTSPQCQQVAPLETTNLAFTQLPSTAGTQGATLQIVGDNSALVNPAAVGPVDLLSIDTLEDVNPTVFQLTTAEGFTYVIDQQRGATSVTDPNGNTLTINSSGITSSDGKSVVFSRDGSSRITQIADPAGHTIRYTYSAAGDLASSTDAAGNITTYSYDSTHLLTNVVDPSGVQAIRQDYDSQGRLIDTIDALGHKVTYTHSVAAQIESVTDRLGNTTVYGYDANGNIISTTDPLGNVTTATFDAASNKLSETNALGKTRTYTYDAFGNKLTEKDPLGNLIVTTYNQFNKPLTITDPLGRITTDTYDARGNLLSTKDPLGNVTSYTYASNGLRATQTDPLGHTTSYAYDTTGNLSQTTDALGHKTTYTYDANGNRLSQAVSRTRSDGTVETLTTKFQYDGKNRLIVTTYPDGTTSQQAYNSIGKKSDIIDQLGHKTHFDYDDIGRTSKITFADGTFESMAYDADSRRISSTDRAGRTTSFTYDADGRMTRITYPDASSTQTSYDAAGRIIQTVDALGHPTLFGYDDANRRNSVTDALGNVTTFNYDAAGNQTSATDALHHTTQLVYDANNRHTKTVYPDLSTDSITYDADGHVIARMDQGGNTTQFGLDAIRQLVSVTDALGKTTTYTYDEVGDRITQTDANANTTKFAYDQLGRRTSQTLPLGMSGSSAYDAAGNVTSKTDFNGHKTTYTYDVMNRLTMKTADPFFASGGIGAAQVTYLYTPTGKRSSMTDASGTTSYTYDSRDRVLSKITPFGTLTYTYDVAANTLSLKSSNTGGANASYAYDALNRLSTVTDAAGVTTYGYDAAGNLTGLAQPNGVSTSYTYDTLNRLTNLTATCGAGTGCGTPTTALASYAYTLGAAGNRLSVAELGTRTVAYGYDSDYHLTSESVAGDPSGQNGTIAYVYDAVGNRLQRNSSVPAIPPAVLGYDANDRITTQVYDANGNTTSDGLSNIYDFENHMVQRGGVSIVYDGDGNRVSETAAGVTTNYLVADSNPSGYAQVLEELQSGAVTRSYTYGLDLISERQTIGGTGVTSFYGHDGQGSVRFLMDSTGKVTDTYTFDAFGLLVASTGSTPNVYLFAGQQFDPALGVYYNRARYLDVRTGRFFTQDTKAGELADPPTLHRYLYARANPVNRSDPGGLQDDLVELSVEEGVEETLDATEISSEGLQQLPNQIADELSATTEVEGDSIADAEFEAESEAEVSEASEGEYVDEPSTTGRAAKYQEYATGRPAGQAYKLNGVKFDSFENGNLIDAKGAGYARLFQQGFADSVKSKLSQELIRQIGARAGAKIIWRIAEEEAVPIFEQLVEEAGGSGIVDVVFYPPPFPL